MQIPSNQYEETNFDKLLQDTQSIKTLAELINTKPESIRQALLLRSSPISIPFDLQGKNGQTREVFFTRGYNTFSSLKPNGAYRTINDPAPDLKVIQRRILDVLLYQIPIHAGAYGGKKGKGFVDNAKVHRDNHSTNLVQTDLKGAFPSVDSQRVHNVLTSTLEKTIDISFPTIKEEERENIIDMLVALISFENELPQGAPSSQRMLDIVMAKSDQEISRYLSEGTIALFNPKQTRYVDDISVSWREFSDMHKVWKIRTNCIKLLTETGAGDDMFNSDKIASEVGALSQNISEIMSISFVVNNEKQRSFIIELLKDISKKLSGFKRYSTENSHPELTAQIETLQKEIASMRYGIEQNPIADQATSVLKDIEKILYKQGWQINTSKRSVWTPDSSGNKIVTGVSIDQEGKLGVPIKNQRVIEDFLNKAMYDKNLLPDKFQHNPDTIPATILGYRNYVMNIRDGSLGNLAKIFKKASLMYDLPTGYSQEGAEVWSGSGKNA